MRDRVAGTPPYRLLFVVPRATVEGCVYLGETEVRKAAGAAADVIRIQYGGSVTAANANEILGQPDIDGALVGFCGTVSVCQKWVEWFLAGERGTAPGLGSGAENTAPAVPAAKTPLRARQLPLDAFFRTSPHTPRI